MRSIRSYFTKLVEENPDTTDQITNVRNPSNTATWYRTNARSPSWATVTFWAIDAALGHDENAGGDEAPLRTWAEFSRRVGELLVSMTVEIRSNLDEGIMGSFSAIGGVDLVIDGVPTSVVSAGSVTTFTNPVRVLGACEEGTMTSDAVADFTPHVGKMLIAYYGGSEYATPVLGVTAGGSPLLSFWNDRNFNTGAPANGTRVDIVTLPTVRMLNLTLSGGLGFNISKLKILSPTFMECSSIVCPAFSGATSSNRYFACDFAGFFAEYSETFYMGCQASAEAPDTQLALGFWDYGSAVWLGGGSRNRIWLLRSGGHTAFQGFIVEGGGVEVGWSDHQSRPSSLGVWGESLGLGIFDASSTPFGATGNGLDVCAGANVSGKSIYGARNQGFGMNVRPGGKVNILYSPTITGDQGDLRFDGSAVAIPMLVPGAPVPGALPLSTWTQWTDDFDRRVMSYSTGAVLAIGLPLP